MTAAFSENEKELIRDKLIEAAKECIMQYGVRKTTVEQLVQIAGISKGSFYSFYQSKEVLFFIVLEDYQRSIINNLINEFMKGDKIGIDTFTNTIFELYQDVRNSFIMSIIKNNEFEYLMRKLPQEVIINHHTLDDIFTENIFSYIKIRDDVNINAVTASLRAIFMSMIFVQEIGENYFNDALKLLIKGLALQIICEDENE